VINSYLGLDIAKVWGEARSVAADGTEVNTLLDNLLAERHIRYGGYGGIAYHHVADNYIALFSHFIPCGVWEAVYIIEGLLKQRSDADPDTIHADTQGQSFPVHALAHLFGFELLTRIRNWKDRVFYRPGRDVVYRHIDALFGEPGQNEVDWRLIESHWQDLMRIVISIREGRLSSVLLLRRLSTESRRNNVYKAFRELGRAICTITLLRLISEPELRGQIDAATNKVESYNNFSSWLAFGAEAIERNDPAEQEKLIKFNTLLANCVIFHIAIDMTTVVRRMIADGRTVDLDDLATMAPYITERIKRFGEYPIDGLDMPPEAFDPRLALLGAPVPSRPHDRGVLARFVLAFASRWRSSGARLRFDSYCRRSEARVMRIDDDALAMPDAGSSVGALGRDDRDFPLPRVASASPASSRWLVAGEARVARDRYRARSERVVAWDWGASRCRRTRAVIGSAVQLQELSSGSRPCLSPRLDLGMVVTSSAITLLRCWLRWIGGVCWWLGAGLDLL
jgi:TnpA family transposase